MIRPVSLPLKSTHESVVSARFLQKAHLGELGISDHQVASDKRHLDRNRPLFILSLTGSLLGGWIDIRSFRAVFLGPGKRALILVWIVDTLLDAPEHFGHIDRLDAHSQILLEERLIHDRSRDPH